VCPPVDAAWASCALAKLTRQTLVRDTNLPTCLEAETEVGISVRDACIARKVCCLADSLLSGLILVQHH